ncbi:MAG: TSUP family transporter [Veillonella sp.]|nr:TSUP family transporter [Veillonella sp.]MCF0156384.1 TSUP family transporter [Veillonella sp.]
MEFLGLDSHYSMALLLFVAGAFAGFVDSIVGGGGLISVPAMLLTNLPPAMALGTNKMASIFGALTASITFMRNRMVDYPFVKKLLPFVFVGSMLGTLAVISLPPLYVKPLLIVLLLAVMIFVLTKKSWGEVNRKSAVVGKTLYLCMAMVLGLGFYDGFIGPGVGTFLIMGFIFAGFDFVHASGNAKVINFTSNLASLIVFFSLGYVNLFYGLSCAVGQIVGATIGSKLAITKGSGLVRGVFICVTSLMLIKLIYDYIGTL